MTAAASERRCDRCAHPLLACECGSEAFGAVDHAGYWDARYLHCGIATVGRLEWSASDLVRRTERDVGLLEALLEEYVPWTDDRPRRLFEMGAGWGRILERLEMGDWDVAGCDASPEAVRLAAERELDVRLYAGGPTSTPDGWADVVLSWTCLQHVPAPAVYDVAREMLRVLRPGGLILVHENTTPDLVPGHAFTTYRTSVELAAIFPAARPLGCLEHEPEADQRGERHSTLVLRAP